MEESANKLSLYVYLYHLGDYEKGNETNCESRCTQETVKTALCSHRVKY